MFKQAAEDTKETAKSLGFLTLTSKEPYKNISDIVGLKHCVTYNSHNVSKTGPTNIFDCCLTLKQRIIVIDNLTIAEESINMGESTLHMFFDLFLSEVPNWIRHFGKEIVIIKTDIPHCSELFVEYNYSLRRGDLFGFDKGYRATFRLNKHITK